jgi:hypothetical protein
LRDAVWRAFERDAFTRPRRGFALHAPDESHLRSRDRTEEYDASESSLFHRRQHVR